MKWSVLPLLASILACGPATRNGNGDDGNGGGGDGAGSGSDGCSASAKLVYVVDEGNKLSQFDPTTKTFHDLGTLTCPASLGGTPFSMGVDRGATAWVLYSSGEVFKVDTGTLMCTKTSYAAQLGLVQFGMGFSTDTVGGNTDHLFVAGGAAVQTGTTSKLATLDTGTMMASSVGQVTGWPELTGNANAELWGFFPDINGSTTPRVEQINKASGAPVAGKTYMQPTLSGQAMAWAFAFYGGDYWLFLMKGAETSTTVYQVDGAAGSIKGSTPAPGRVIVGAGVSTCAPVVIE
jgi:hypothetical protein